jgi:serine O-acetyltransferase
MIKTKQDLEEYLRADREAQPPSSNPIRRIMFDRVYRLKTRLRKTEYHFNNRGGGTIKRGYHKAAYQIYHLLLRHTLISFCSEIGLNTCGKGLIIWHAERILINPLASLGENCSLSSGVVVAQAHNQCPTIMDNVELMIDSKVLGGITIARNVRIGANALVLKNISEENTTWAGNPARKISDIGAVETPVIINK